MDFHYPINVICFNRPDYLEEFLISLKDQSIQVSSDLVIFWVDGFPGSQDENLGLENKTKQTVSLIRQYFPKCRIEISEFNLGIARNYWRAEIESFEKLGAQSAFFFEEDLVLSSNYLQFCTHIDSIIGLDTDISHISVSGDVSHMSSSIDEYFQAFGHNWGYLLRGWHHFERRSFLEEYLSLMENYPYFKRAEIEKDILGFFFKRGILLAGTSQDAVKDALRNHFGRISVTTKLNFSTNIGVVGEHSKFQNRHHFRPLETDLSNMPKTFPADDKARLFNDGVRKTIDQIFRNYLRPYVELKVEHQGLQVEHQGLQVEHQGLQVEHQGLQVEHQALLNSTIWRTTYWIRWIADRIKRF
jgi:hypothetical protein